MTDERIQSVAMPKWGLSMTQGTVTEWLVAEGDEIAPGQDLVEIDTDKIVGTLESTQEGVLRGIVTTAGQQAPVGGTIAIVAPPDVPQTDIDTALEQANADNAAGPTEDDSGPRLGTVDIDGRSIAYAALGPDGDDEPAAIPIVFVHGYGGDKNSWLFVQEPLSSDRTTYAIDLPGHGDSSKDVGDGSVATLAATVNGFLTEIGIEKAHLVGHSLGGAVVAATAATHPTRVASVTVAAPAGVGTEINADYLRGFASAGARRELKPVLGDLFADASLVNRQLVEDLLKYKRLDGVPQALTTLVDTLLNGDGQALDVTGQLGALTVPVAVVWGEADRILPAGNAAALPENATLHRVPDAGHMVQMESPGSVRNAITDAIG